ncbi:MAG: AMP-binding protein [bacterium]|nr:AMP-binding protein [bacterium]
MKQAVEAGPASGDRRSADPSGWITWWAERAPARVAVVFGGEQVSYAELEVRVRGVAARLDTMGVGAGDRVAVCCSNRIEMLELVFACARIGAMLAPVNNRLTPPEVRFQLEDCQPALVLADAAHECLIREAGGEPEDLDGFASRAHDDRCQGAGPAPRMRGDPERSLLLVYTSGTTGTPKGAVLSQRSLFYTVSNAIAHEGFDTGSVVASVLPLFHVGGLNIQTIPCLFAGGTVVLAERFHPAGLIEIMRRHRPTHVLLVPAAMSALLAEPSLAPQDLASLGALNCGSSVVSEDLIRRFNALGVRVVQVYGSTETGPTAVVLDYEDADRIGSCGKPARHCELRIVDSDGADVAAGETGELWVRGQNLFTGYWNRPEETGQAFSDGWYVTGDLGYADEDGFVWISGRKRELIISGGENVYPAEVERAVGEHPSVSAVAVVGRPHARWGEVPVAFVVPAAGASVEVEGLDEWCRNQLARYKRPRDWIVVDELPRTALGKVRKHMLLTGMAACVGKC